MKKNIVAVNNLSVILNDEAILEDLSFTVKQGEVLIVLGPNGAGKTTLLKALLHLIAYTGSVHWHTRKISYLPPQELLLRRDLPPLSIADFFSFKNVSRHTIHEYISYVGLSHTILDKQFTELSTGQFQRMLVAWALVDNPEVLVFDEPTAGIDIGGEETIYSLLHRFWKERSLTIILVTHDLQIVWEHATNVLCLNKKQICYGQPEGTLTPEVLKKLYGAGITAYEHRYIPK